MEDSLSFDSFVEENSETQLMLNVSSEAEQDFLAKVGGTTARKADVAAMVDQYNATQIGTLCFDGSAMTALAIWAERCHALGLVCLLNADATTDFESLQNSLCADGIVLDCRNLTDYSVIEKALKATGDGLLYLLVSAAPAVFKEQNVELSAADAIIVCADEGSCEHVALIDEWMSDNTDYCVYAGVSSVLCEANGKTWFTTPEILNGFAVQALMKGCAGLWLNGFCADLFEPDSALYDIYETCGLLSECVGAKRRHVIPACYPRIILPGADYHFTCDVSPVFEGAPVCVVLALSGAQNSDSLSVSVNGDVLEFTGEPEIVARNEKGRFCANQCIPVPAKTFEYFLGNIAEDESFTVCIHNNTKNELSLHWCEITVNI